MGLKSMSLLKVVLLIVSLTILCSPTMANGQLYYVLAYGDSIPESEGPVLLRCIDLNTAQILHTDTVSMGGYLYHHTPIRFERRSHKYLATFVQCGGGASKNTLPGRHRAYRFINEADSSIQIVRADSFIDTEILVKQYSNQTTFWLGMERSTNLGVSLPFDEYSINESFNIVRVRPNSAVPSKPGQLPDMGNFRFPTPVDSIGIPGLYYCRRDFPIWLIRLNDQRNTLIDSVQLQDESKASAIFAYHPNRDKFYCFHLNYEYPCDDSALNKSYGQYWILPEVFIYNPATLTLLERIPIADFSSGNYPGYEDGLANIVGDFIVYYFFMEDDEHYYSPAMLFIFDTRTNQATWLRVGWR